MEDSKLNTVQFAQSLFGLEPDTPIFDDISEVTFMVKDKEITDTTFFDVAWKFRTFIFDGAF